MTANQRHLPQLPVLYSFRRCPYAMRARLGLAVSHTQVELREILLRDKPEHMLTLSPKGTVPVLWLPDGTVIDESLDVMLWALRRNDPQGWLNLSPSQEKQAREWVSLLDGDFKYHLDRYKYSNRYENCDPQEHLKQCLTILEPWEQALSEHAFLLGEQAKYVDYAVLPFVRQFRIADPHFFDQEPELTHIRGWLNRYLDSELFKTIMPKFKQWQPDDRAVLFP
ncbi:MAG: glutathione S-transferase, partial [Limnobacter sp.]|nr:glutathione S-transferase [Limnobacter sp.]